MSGNTSRNPVLVTGATSGLGLEVARQLLAQGRSLILPVRNADAANRLFGDAAATILPMDLARLDSVHALCDRLLDDRPTLGGLLANAGVMPLRREVTPDGFEACFQINFLAQFLLIERLLPLMAPDARIVHVSSLMHKAGQITRDCATGPRPYRWQRAYGTSKLAQIHHVTDLAGRLPRGTMACALHPGIVATNIVRGFPRPIRWAAGKVMTPAAQAAAVPVRLLSADPAGNINGRYLDRGRPIEPHPKAKNEGDQKALMTWAREWARLGLTA